MGVLAKCPYCDGPVDLSKRLPVCMNCHKIIPSGESKNDKGALFKTKILKNMVDEESAKKIIKDRFGKFVWAAKKIVKGSSFTSSEIRYEPFWTAEAEFTAWYSGFDVDHKHIETKEGKYETITERRGDSGKIKNSTILCIEANPKNSVILNEKDLTGEAADSIRVAKLEATLPMEDARKTMEENLEDHIRENVGREVDEVTNIESQKTIKNLQLVYAPIWNVTYSYNGQNYTATILGSNSSIIDFESPGIISRMLQDPRGILVFLFLGLLLYFLLSQKV